MTGDRADLPGLLEPAAATAEEEAAVAAWTQRYVEAVWPKLGLLLAASAVIWWPTDALLFLPDSPERRGLWMLRAVTAPLNLGFALVLPRVPWVLARAAPIVSLLVLAEGAAAGAAVGVMGERWVGFLYLLPLFTTPIPARPGWRALLVAGACACGWLGYAAATPAPLSPEVWSLVIHSVFGALLSLLIGHAGWHALRVALVARHRLAALASSLQARVDEQTTALRRLLERSDRAREEERAALARDLHDDLGQELSALRITLAFGREHPGPAVLDELDSLLDRTGRTVRRMLLALRPRALDELGLAGGLAWLSEEAERRGLACETEVPPGLALDARVEEALFRCAQEALTNVARHARAG
ncbi:MAG TPA: histidine kinase, partial [Myxococcota bacterium]|nr:histidine kinase [Myxococcota bacterium]